MLWIGITGGIASGKSVVTGLLRSLSLPVVCADQLAREVVRRGMPAHAEVVSLFGAGAVADDGELNRKLIGSRVFADRALLLALENVIHPRVREMALERREELRVSGADLAFYDVPLLFEKKMEPLFDLIVVVSCSLELQRARLMARDGFSAEEANRRITSQLPLLEKMQGAHFVIDNNGSLADLDVAVLGLVEKLRHITKIK